MSSLTITRGYYTPLMEYPSTFFILSQATIKSTANVFAGNWRWGIFYGIICALWRGTSIFMSKMGLAGFRLLTLGYLLGLLMAFIMLFIHWF